MDAGIRSQALLQLFCASSVPKLFPVQGLSALCGHKVAPGP